jgi:hypothetical protein
VFYLDVDLIQAAKVMLAHIHRHVLICSNIFTLQTESLFIRLVLKGWSSCLLPL